jgi:hypothetical protein
MERDMRKDRTNK